MDFLISLSQSVSEQLYRPDIFRVFLGALSGISLVVIVCYIIQSKRQEKIVEADKNNVTQFWQKQLKGYESKNNELAQSLNALKQQIDTQQNEIQALTSSRDELLLKKEEMLRQEASAKEKALLELRDTRAQLDVFKNQQELNARELSLANKLKQDLSQKESELKNELLHKEKLSAGLKDAEAQCSALQSKLASTEEMYHGLKEQYEDLERQVDAVGQALALEKTLHQRLKEEHSRCAEPASS